MLERTDAAIDGAGDRLVGVEVRRDVGAGIGRLLDHRLDLVDREAERVDRVVGRGDAAIRHDLDEMGAGLELFARGAAAGVDAVDETAERPETAGEHPVAVVETMAHVAMTAGLAQPLAGDDQPRPGEQPLLDGERQAVVGAAAVAHRGEAARQHRRHDAGGAGRGQRRRRHGVGAKVDQTGDDMDVAVDQAGHQRLAGEVDPFGAGAFGSARRRLP